MNNRNYMLIGFCLTVLIQLIVPASMILSSEETLGDGTEYRFKTVPVDPTDPFRGKYVTLRFVESSFMVDSTATWEDGDDAYVLLGTDLEGFATMQAISRDPWQNQSFIKVRIKKRYRETIIIRYPFERYYMEESKAGPAERVYRDAMRDGHSMAYALVSVYEGNAVLKDVMIDDVPLTDLAETQIVKEKAKETDK